MPKFRKRPVVIDAIQWTGDNMKEMTAFIGPGQYEEGFSDDFFYVKTLEGELRASLHDWIIKGVKGEFYPCKPDIFEATYEAVV